MSRESLLSTLLYSLFTLAFRYGNGCGANRGIAGSIGALCGYGIHPAIAGSGTLRSQIQGKISRDFPVRGSITISETIYWFVAAHCCDLASRR